MNYFTPPFPPRHHQHRNAALDPRRIHMMNDQSYRDRFPPTPQFSSSSPYQNVPATPASPFDASGVQMNFASFSGRINNPSILDDTFRILNFKHPDFIPHFYQSFKTFPPEHFTREVHQNCVTVLKHVIHQLTEQKEFYRKDRDHVRLDLIQKEQELQALHVNEAITRDSIEAQIRDGIRKSTEGFRQLQSNFSNERTTNERLRQELQQERDRKAEMQKALEKSEKENRSAAQSHVVMNAEINRLKSTIQKLREQLGRNDSTEEVNSLKNTVNSLKEQLLAQKADNEETIKKLMEDKEELTVANQELLKDKEDYQESLTKLMKDVEQLDDEKKKLRKDNATCIKSMKAKIDELTQRNDAIHQEQYDANLLKDEIAELKEIINKLQGDPNQKVKAIGELAKASRACGNTVTKFKKTRHATLIGELNSQRALASTTKALLTAKENACDVLNDRIQDYQQSSHLLDEQTSILTGRLKRAARPRPQKDISPKKAKLSHPSQSLSPSSTSSDASTSEHLAWLSC